MKTILSIFAVVLIVGCETPSAPKWEQSFSEDTRSLMAKQVINPDASKNSMMGPTDGKALVGAQTQYSSSYGYAVKEAKPSVVVMPTASGK